MCDKHGCLELISADSVEFSRRSGMKTEHHSSSQPPKLFQVAFSDDINTIRNDNYKFQLSELIVVT